MLGAITSKELGVSPTHIHLVFWTGDLLIVFGQIPECIGIHVWGLSIIKVFNVNVLYNKNYTQAVRVDFDVLSNLSCVQSH